MRHPSNQLRSLVNPGLVAVLLLVCVPSGIARAARIGFAENVITPCGATTGIACGGGRIPVIETLETTGGNAKTITGVASDLQVAAVALEDDRGRPFIFVAVDLLGVERDLVRDVRTRLRALPGLGPDDIVINASHTHTAPTMRFLTGTGCMGFRARRNPRPCLH